MRILGQLCLLAAFVSSGYAAFAYLVAFRGDRRTILRTGLGAALTSLLTLTATVVILGWALLVKDFRFDYVAQYSSQLLAWHYSLSALWVGQAGSLLLWAWILVVLSLIFRFLPTRNPTQLRDAAFGLLMGYVCFLLAIMVFAADPMKPSIAATDEGFGLSPLLQHPSMLIHPPIVFAAYAAWSIPFALAAAALLSGQLDGHWAQQARPWALLAWTVLGVGILLGADWAYQELGWGGYWGWDPVENGSLVPWLTGTALIHSLMAWRHRECLKKTAVTLAIITFGLCNFATFLTRSGIFSSVHAFSQSPIGWMFLGLMLTLVVGGALLVFKRRHSLSSQRPIRSLFARETLVLVSACLLLLLTLVVMVGTLVGPVSDLLLGRQILLGPAFYNKVLVPIGLALLTLTAAVPLLRWGGPPGPTQKKILLLLAGVGTVAVAVAFWVGVRHPISLAVAALASIAIGALIGALLLDAQRRVPGSPLLGALRALRHSRQQYAGYLIHLGFVCLAIGITGSSLGTRRQEALLHEGDVIEWAERRIRYVKLIQRELPDKLVAEAQLEVSHRGRPPVTLLPARHLHLLQNEWTSEVAIHSTWGGDFYTVLDAGLGGGTVALTLVENPMMRWLWFGGVFSALSALLAIWPAKRTDHKQDQPIAPPSAIGGRQRRRELVSPT